MNKASQAAARSRAINLSIIVPVLNEHAQLPALLANVQPLLDSGVELIVVDGGSDDGTAQYLQAQGVMLIRSAKGRARQMNAGAAASHGNVLLFLHADTRLPNQADVAVQTALQKHHVWGRFDVCIAGHHRLLPLVAWLMNARSRLTGIATGDQAIFVRRDAFEAIGGFPALPLMEDIALSKRLKQRSKPSCVRLKVSTSGRRWDENGFWCTVFLMWRLRWAYWRGVSADVLAQAYD